MRNKIQSLGSGFRKTAYMVFAGSMVAAMAGFSGCTWDHVEPEVCFESDVLPIFVAYCSTTGLGGEGCHNPGDRAEGYDFTNYNGIMRGVDAGNPGNSEIMEAIRENGDDQMPPADRAQPTAEQIAAIEDWIKSGAANTTGCATVSCDSGATVTYSGDIQPMLETYCNGCHGSGNPSGGINLSDFAVVKENALSGRLEGVISGDPNYATMPPNSALLPSCYATKVAQWVAAGALNN